MPVLLVIDDDPLTLDCFQFLFPKGQVKVLTAGSAAGGQKLFAQEKPDVVVLDIRLPDLSGLEAFRRFHEVDPKIPVVLMTGYGTADTAIEAMRLGAQDYVVKPLDPASLREVITRALEISRFMRVPAKVAQDTSGNEGVDTLLGASTSMQEVYKAIGRVAPQDVTVLIRGESGTGKELVARALFHYSSRATGPFLAVNCAAIPETLLESELFGHERGAFTGADRKRIGKFEQCDKGTLFLDEIGDMTPLTQAKILRVLQDKQFEPIGGNKPIKTDVRILAATNRDLEGMIGAGQFRGDLYYRLNVCTIQLPPLRERGDDLIILSEYFLRHFSVELGKAMHTFAPESLQLLRSYPWPGNVRELQSVLKQAILQSTGPVLLPQFLAPPVRGENTSFPCAVASGGGEFPDLAKFIDNRLNAESTQVHAEVLAATEQILFLQMLRHTANNLSQAARILGISRATLRNKLAGLGISIERTTSVEEDEGN